MNLFDSYSLPFSRVKELQELHKKAFGTNFNADGYPDTGNGRYSQLLDYEEWVQFNNGQRAHFNMIESSGPTLACVLGVGLYYPITASVLGFIYGTGRVVYTIGYLSKSGADARLAGALLGLIGTFGLYFTALSIPIRNKLM